MARRKKSPYAGLPRPPYGTYDPSIDASQRAAQRGYSDLQADTNRAGTRAMSDFNISLEDLGRTRDYGLQDIGRNVQRGIEDFGTQRKQIETDFNRNLADIGQNRTRLTEDHGTALANLQRRYELLGGSQRQAASAAGVSSGGVLRQALAKRQANQNLESHPINESFQRGLTDLSTSEARLRESESTALANLDTQQRRAGEDAATQGYRFTQQYGTGKSSYTPGTNAWADAWLAKNPGQQLPGGPIDTGTEGARLSLGYQRGAEDRSTQVRRGGRELNAYTQDLIPVRYYSAAGLNQYTPKKRRR